MKGLDLYSQPVANIIPNPVPTSALNFWNVTNRGTAGNGTQTYDATESAFLDTWTNSQTNATYTFRIGTTGSNYMPVIPGYYLACSIWVKSSRADNRAFIYDPYGADGVTARAHTLVGLEPGWDGGTRVALPANTWTQLYFHEQIPLNAFLASCCVMWTGSAGTTGATHLAGDTVKFRQAQALMSPNPIPIAVGQTYHDSSTPGWRATGLTSVRTTQHIGYPRAA